MTIPLTGAPGFRSLHELWDIGRRGGLKYFPYSAIQSGLVASATLPATATPTATPAALSVAITAGTAYLDGSLATLASNVTYNLTPVAANLVDGLNMMSIYLNPSRRMVVSSLAPTAIGAPNTLLNGDAVVDGDLYARAYIHDDHDVAQEFFERKNGAWVPFNPIYAPPTLEGYNYIWGNAMAPKLALSNFSTSLEKRLYNKNAYRPYTQSKSLALVRETSSLEMATASLYYVMLPFTFIGTITNGSADITISDETRARIADITGAAGSVAAAALRVDSFTGLSATAASRNITAISASGINPATITLASPATATSNNVLLTIVPQTAGNNYALIPAKSKFERGLNLVHQ